MIREFGAAAYAEVMTWPRRLILRAIEIERERQAAQREAFLTDVGMGDQMDLGRRYVDPKAKKDAGGAYYDLSPFNRHRDALARMARPWEYTPEAVQERREAAEDALWQKFQEVGGMRA